MKTRAKECPACGKSGCFRNWCFRLKLKIYWQKDGTPNYGYYAQKGRGDIQLRRWSAKCDKEPQVLWQTSFEWPPVKKHDDPTAV